MWGPTEVKGGVGVSYERGKPVPFLQDKVHEYVRVQKYIMWERLGERARRERHRAVWEKDKQRPASHLTLEVFNQNLVFGKRFLQRAAPPTQRVNFEPTFRCNRRHHTARNQMLPPRSGLRRHFCAILRRKSVALSAGTPLCPYIIAYRRVYGLSTSGLLLKMRFRCVA